MCPSCFPAQISKQFLIKIYLMEKQNYLKMTYLGKLSDKTGSEKSIYILDTLKKKFFGLKY